MDYFEHLIKKVGVNVLCVAYRGYSRSEGKPSEQGLQLDAVAVAEFVKKSDKIDKKRVFLIGRSLGGAVALHLLAKIPNLFKAAIVENTFTNMDELCTERFPIFKVFPILKKILLRITWNNLAQLKDIECPLFYIAGD